MRLHGLHVDSRFLAVCLAVHIRRVFIQAIAVANDEVPADVAAEKRRLHFQRQMEQVIAFPVRFNATKDMLAP